MQNVFAATSRIKGTGCFAAKDFKKGEVIGEYTGEIIDEEEADERYGDAPITYLFTIDDGYIDGGTDDNPLKYINHGCGPNCESEQDGNRILIKAIKRIKKGDELTYDYHLQVDDDDADPYTCLCGARACRGTMRAAS